MQQTQNRAQVQDKKIELLQKNKLIVRTLNWLLHKKVFYYNVSTIRSSSGTEQSIQCSDISFVLFPSSQDTWNQLQVPQAQRFSIFEV